MTAAEVMRLVRHYASGVGTLDEQAAAYLAVAEAVAALAEPVKPEPMPVVGWAVLDAEGRALFGYITSSDFPAREVALRNAELMDGRRIAPLVLADLDDVAEDPS